MRIPAPRPQDQFGTNPARPWALEQAEKQLLASHRWFEAYHQKDIPVQAPPICIRFCREQIVELCTIQENAVTVMESQAT